MKLSDHLALLAMEDNGTTWRIEQEPHDHADGTTHFTHVAYDTQDRYGVAWTVRIMEYTTPHEAALAVALHNNVRQIIDALRASGN